MTMLMGKVAFIFKAPNGDTILLFDSGEDMRIKGDLVVTKIENNINNINRQQLEITIIADSIS